jgi:pimeloyl-[acyl-carrier protein] methyl ester esterase
MATTPCFVAVPGWPDAMREEVLAQFAGNLENDPRQTLERFLSLQVRGSEAARQSLRRLKSGLAQRPAPGVAALEAGLRLLAATDLRQRLSEVRCESLWMYGQRDTLVPAAACDAVRPMQPNGRFLTFPGAGHAPFLSHAGACLEAIDAFMEAVHAPLF